MGKLRRLFGLKLVFAFAAGCASIDFDYPKSESFAFKDTDDTYLGRGVADYVTLHPGESGFYPVYDGIDSLALRLLMAERAERNIDAQYFLIRDDLVGNVFIESLLKAANRGVRVRLLIDDIQAEGFDAGLAILDSIDNFEVRIFNPFAHRSARVLDVPTRLSRITRRMHNKSFTVDNQMTLIGGRNIADEYFDARADENFGDLDVLAIGPVVPEVSELFDSYWNHRASLPMPALAKVPGNAEEVLASLHQKVARTLEEVAASKYADAVGSSVLNYVQTDASAFIWATYELVFDSPDKALPDKSDTAASITTQLLESIVDVEQELFVVTPYLVLIKEDIDSFREYRDRNIEITVLTNSLASNNHTVSHSGYAPVRKPLLEMGVKLYELRANANIPGDERVDAHSAKSTLHAKAFVVDRKRVFIGSFNWNQRSANLDTEMGVIIHSPKIATELVEQVTAALPAESFEVYLNESGKLRWRGHENGQEVILDKEPQTGFWQRFSARILRIMPIKSQL